MLNSKTIRRTVKPRSLAGKTIILVFAILFAAGLTSSRAQNAWTQKADFGGTARNNAVGFSIGSKGYIGTGVDFYGNLYNDFWEYDPSTDSWTQKSNFSGTARYLGVGFSIGSKGYIGTGGDGSNIKKRDFWEYDPATNAWTKKANVGGTARAGATGFSIGTKGYIGTGYDANGYKEDFWEYDPATDAWTKKANYGGGTRTSAVGFSIGTKGYIGTGFYYDGSPHSFNDFWEYDPSTNTWTQKANFGGIARYGAIGFSIGSKGYLGTGYEYDYYNGDIYYNDFWEYDPVTGAWIQRTDFGGTARAYAFGFSVGSKGYVGTGSDEYNVYNDFWEYTLCNNGSNVYADADGDGYGNADNSIFLADCIAPGGYVTDSTDCNDANANVHPGVCDDANGVDDNCDGVIDDMFGTVTFYEDDDGDSYGDASTTTQACSAPNGYVSDNTDCNDASAGVHPNATEVCNGVDDDCDGFIDEGVQLTFYADADGDGYGDAGNSTLACSVPDGYATNNTDCQDANALIHPGAPEILNGIDDNCNGIIDDTGIWIQKADFGGTARPFAVGFSIGSKGYIGTGRSSGLYGNGTNDFWEYDPATDSWAQKADFGGTGRLAAVGFSIGNKGYIGTGVSFSYSQYDLEYLIYYKDFWEYDPATNAWKRRANFGGTARDGAVGFSIGSKGYIGTGDNYPNYDNDFWEYDPATDTWTQKANFAGTARSNAVGFSIGSKGYIGTGYSNSYPYYTNDFWEYEPATDTWTQKANFAGTARSDAVGFSIGSKGYIGTGQDIYYTLYNDFWEYDPSTDAWSQKANFGGTKRYDAVGFSIGNKGYIGTGYATDYEKNDFWEYTSCSNGLTFYADADGDGYGNVAISMVDTSCNLLGGYVFDSTDCNDAPDQSGASVHPNATEVCNSIDDNCNGVIDEGCGGTCVTPTNLSTSNITGTSAKINWDAVAGAEIYKVRYKVSGTGNWSYIQILHPHKKIVGLTPATEYTWQIKTYCQMDPDIMSNWSSPQTFITNSLRFGDEAMEDVSFQIYPNPAEDHATIQFTLPQSSHVYIKVYDVSGKEITTLVDDNVDQGAHSLLLNTNQFSKGAYLVKMISDFGIENQKLIVQ